jgi:hypothetical protein
MTLSFFTTEAGYTLKAIFDYNRVIAPFGFSAMALV